MNFVILTAVLSVLNTSSRMLFALTRRGETPERLVVKMWLYPFLTYASIVGIVAVLVLMLFSDDARSPLFFSLISVAVVLVAYLLQRGRGRVPDASPVPTESGVA